MESSSRHLFTFVALLTLLHYTRVSLFFSLKKNVPSFKSDCRLIGEEASADSSLVYNLKKLFEEVLRLR